VRTTLYVIALTFYIIFLTFVQQPLVRLLIINHSQVEILCKFMNDGMWILPTMLLPLLLARMLVRRIHEKGARVFVFVVAAMLTLFALFDFMIYFRFVIVMIIVYVLAVLFSKWTVQRILYLLVLGMIVFHYKGQLLPTFSSADTNSIKILSFNLNSRQRKKPELMAIKLAKEHHFDILLFQELPKNSPDYLVNELSEEYPYQLTCEECSPYYSVMILSKIPFVSKVNYVVEYNEKSSFEINHAVLSYEGQHINLLNCHVSNPVGSLRVEGSKIEIRDKVINQYEKHEKEGQLLLSFIRQLEGPVILGTDLNDTPNSKLYHFLTKHVQDCYAKAGWGLGTTYGYWIFKELSPKWLQNIYFYPVRIDYIFSSSQFKVKKADVLKMKSSEHLPVTAELVLKK